MNYGWEKEDEIYSSDLEIIFKKVDSLKSQGIINKKNEETIENGIDPSFWNEKKKKDNGGQIKKLIK